MLFRLKRARINWPQHFQFYCKSDFKELIQSKKSYVDKSLFVKDFLEDPNKVVIINRPKGWGKSLNMSMVRQFLELETDDNGLTLSLEKKTNFQLFHKIFHQNVLFKEPEKAILSEKFKLSNFMAIINQQGKYPVVYLDFSNVEGNKFQDLIFSLKKEILRAFKHHLFLSTFLNQKKLLDTQLSQLQSILDGHFEDQFISQSLHLLTELLFLFYERKSIILIDNYDHPINQSQINLHNQESQQFQKVYNELIKFTIQQNLYMDKSLLCGTIPQIQSKKFNEYSIHDFKYQDHFGFSQQEIEKLFQKADFHQNSEELKQWFDGYPFGNQNRYVSESIIKCFLNKGKVDYFWKDQESGLILDQIFQKNRFQEMLLDLIDGKLVYSQMPEICNIQNIYFDNEKVLAFLTHAGYVACNGIKPNQADIEFENLDIYSCHLEHTYSLDKQYVHRIPNKEILGEFTDRLKQWVLRKLDFDQDLHSEMSQMLKNGEKEKFLLEVQKLFKKIPELKKHNLTQLILMRSLLLTFGSDFEIQQAKIDGIQSYQYIFNPINGDTSIVIQYHYCLDIDHNYRMAHYIFQEQVDEKKLNQKKYIKSGISICGNDLQFYSKEYIIDDKQ